MAGSSSALSQLLPVSLWERTVFVKCTPGPTTFTQRRAVLRALQKNTSEGIEIFRKLRRDSTSFVAVTTKPDTATALINTSPFERTLIAEDATTADELRKATWGAMFGSPRTITTPVNPVPNLETTPATDSSNELGLSLTTFTIRCFPPNKTFNHLEAVRTSLLHGQWPDSGPWPDNGTRETFISAALRRSVPAGPLAPGLRDWVSGNQLSRDTCSGADEAGEGALSILLGRSRAQVYANERARIRLKEKEISEVMKSLAAFAAKCKDEARASEDQQAQEASESDIKTLLGDDTIEEIIIPDSDDIAATEHDDPAMTNIPKNHSSNMPAQER